MSGSTKALGLALVCVLAMGTMSSSASAEGFFFGAEDEPTLKGSQDGEGNVLTTTAGSFKCGAISYSGLQDESQFITFEMEPSYSECTLGGFGASVDANGCKYRFEAQTEEGPPYQGELDIVCPSGKEITVTASLFGTSKCVIHIPPQTGLESVTFTNTGSGSTREITIDLGVTGLKYTHTGGSGFGACSGGSSESGTQEGAVAVSGESKGAHTGLAVNLTAVGTHLEVEPNPKLDFSGDAVGKVRNFTVRNKHAATMELKKILVVDNMTKEDKTNFEILANSSCLKAPSLAYLAECQIEVKMKVKNEISWLHLEYTAGWWWSAIHKIKRDITS